MCVPICLTRRYGDLRATTSSSCGGLVAFSRLEGPSGPLDSCKKKKIDPHFFYRGPQPPCRRPPYPLHRVYIYFFIGPPPLYPPPAATPLPLAQSFFFFFFFAILDFTDVKNMTERNGGDQARFFMWMRT